MKKVILFTIGVVLLYSCQHRSTTHKEIDLVFKNYYRKSLELFPLGATAIGDNRFNDTLPNNLDSLYINQLIDFYTHYKEQLQRIDLEGLDSARRLNYDILLWELDINLEALQFSDQLTLLLQGSGVQFSVFPMNQFWTLQLTIGQMAGGSSLQPFETVEDYHNWLKRIDDYLQWVESAVENMRQAIPMGYVLPKAIVDKLIPQIESFTKEPVEDHIFYRPIHSFPDSIGEKDKKELANLYSQKIKNDIIPAYTSLLAFLRGEYLQACRETSGIDYLPDGEKIYQFLIKYYTTTNLTADEIFELGEKEVKRITQEMIRVKDAVGFEGDLLSFFEFVRNNPELKPFTDPQQVLDYYEAIHETMKPQLAELFELVPKTPFEIRRVEAFREKSASAGYSSGSMDGTRPGIFYVPIPDVREYNIFTNECLFLHEAIPGHHYQISLQQENSSLPEFQRLSWYNAYGEGWALYCESLGEELGLYADPFQYFGMLSYEMHRAIRLVVDVGIHVKGWTREQAIAYSLAHEAVAEDQIISEIERYMSGPAQALSYKIGQLKIQELRRMAENELANQFDSKVFHAVVLESGCLPLVLLEEKVKTWIAAEKLKSRV